MGNPFDLAKAKRLVGRKLVGNPTTPTGIRLRMSLPMSGATKPRLFWRGASGDRVLVTLQLLWRFFVNSLGVPFRHLGTRFNRDYSVFSCT